MRFSDYISGSRRGKEANRLERKALRDPFLRDAIDGYDRLKKNPDTDIDFLRKRIRVRTDRKHRNIAFLSAAASLLVLLVAGSYFLFVMEKSSVSNMLSHEQEIPYMEEAIQSPPPPPPVMMEEPIVELSESDGQQEIAELVEEVVPILIPRQNEERKQVQTPRTTIQPSTLASGMIHVSGNGLVFGLLTDEYGEPVIGANVVVKGTTNGTITDIDGFFELQANLGDEVTFGYVGYESLTIPVKEGSSSIAMHESSQALDEVVVIGYGVQKKSMVTGSVSTIQSEDITTSTEYIPKSKPVIGNRAFKRYIKENLRQPESEACKDKKGKVKLRFYINNYGRPYNIRIVKSLCEEADKEAIRLIEEGCDWTTGEREITLSIKFK